MGLFDNKTEAPTQKRRDDARKKGQVAKSREVVSILVLAAGLLAVRSSGPRLVGIFRDQLEYYLDAAMIPDRTAAVQQVPLQLMIALASALLPLLVAVCLAALCANMAQTGPMLVGESLKWDFTKLNPAQGLKRLFSPQSLAELAKASAKVGLVGYVVYVWMVSRYPDIMSMCWMDLGAALQYSGALVRQMLGRTLGVLFAVAAADYAWQRYSHEKQLKMSRDELRDEFRQQEGAPEIKAALRRRMRELATGRMLQEVAKADVVVTNPTHYAVALQYDMKTMDAPKVVALGQRLLAQKIKELAKEHDVPIVENKPLARALFEACEVGDSVPPDLYAAVAEVLAYVYRLKGKSLADMAGR